MLREAAGLKYPWAPAYRALIEAAYAEPVLRDLYPFTSHWALRFSSTTRPRLTVVGPCVTANGEGEFGVGRGLITSDLGVFAFARDAVAAALTHVPAGLGPVALGAARR
ncbi:hypothetical protein SAMN05216483_5292 [Streptomyces sp. 2131.1]|uniref:DUF6193 family natural product biosynthesis protein n=1 Tax=Streptomyces sp. 2131.1 TaxID=1855346 RepID=UPI00089C05FD|nr:DUF6193 family natural product biosynthesis protein [Streptomyces sp. 2131.1]SEE07950.1 hypothetical protein SAMN05216483_5292 [Streptomyces sp. 2131.1]